MTMLPNQSLRRRNQEETIYVLESTGQESSDDKIREGDSVTNEESAVLESSFKESGVSVDGGFASFDGSLVVGSGTGQRSEPSSNRWKKVRVSPYH